MTPDQIDSTDGVQPFLILGAAKCATTSLYRYMSQHPDVMFSDPKEPVFFEAEFEQGLAFYRSKYFRHWRGERAVGEARAHNLALPFVPERVHALLPNARLIAVLRDPVDRLYSEWWHRYSRGLEQEPLAAAIRTNLARREAGETFDGDAGVKAWRTQVLRGVDSTAIRYALYLELGYYAEQIRRYRALFPGEQLRVVLYDDLRRDADAVVRDLWRFVGVDPSAPLQVEERHNVALGSRRHPVAAAVRQFTRSGPLRRIAASPVAQKLKPGFLSRPAVRPAMDPETERWLLDHYAPHSRALEEDLGRSLPGWFEGKPARTKSPD